VHFGAFSEAENNPSFPWKQIGGSNPQTLVGGSASDSAIVTTASGGNASLIANFSSLFFSNTSSRKAVYKVDHNHCIEVTFLFQRTETPWVCVEDVGITTPKPHYRYVVYL